MKARTNALHIVRNVLHKSRFRVATQLRHSSELRKKSGDKPINIVADLDLSDLDDLENLEPEIENVHLDAGTTTLEGLDLTAPSLFNRLNTRAIDFARDRAAELVTEITDTTRDRLNSIIVDGMEDQLTRDEIADNIMKADDIFGETRAYLIADTEIGIANGAGAVAGLEEAQAAGVSVKKQWLITDEETCDECTGNADQGPIDVDEEFDSGDDATPAHPNCRCTIIGVVDEND